MANPDFRYIGYLATHERYFLGLDTLPLLIGISTYMFFWPGRYLTPESRVAKDTTSSDSGTASPGADVELGNGPLPPATAGGAQLVEKDIRVP